MNEHTFANVYKSKSGSGQDIFYSSKQKGRKDKILLLR